MRQRRGASVRGGSEKKHKYKVIKNEDIADLEVAEEASWGLAELQGLTVRMIEKYNNALTKY